ncbi:DUF3857 domain-containing protein [Sphingomonas sp. R-74633]|uniref:DUF3857 domain-containing protein n=1 Tax=Sphingomonas sp. R-74633 TaxID=2751188 RepID=UPI0015D3CA5F|nr:DUF3857 domain-containing protein [Sphingomonas sp. R-74633]NYT42915.1 DUF3857 domain-containing protein [Sphingomonas sp. R-74633]
MVRRLIVAALLCGTAGVAHAGDKPLYQSVPAWVTLAPEPATANPGSDAPAMMISDVQARLADGQSWVYYERAARLTTIQTVSSAGTVKIDWQPAHGDLIVHSVDILRGGKRIDALKGAKFTVIQREQGLERMMLDGRLTATLAVEGLQVGDVLDLRYSVTSKDPTLKGNAVAMAPIIAEPVKIGFARTRLLWPTGTDVKWKAYSEGAVPEQRDAGGWHEMLFKQPVMRQQPSPGRMPGRFFKPPIVEATTFPDWQSVSKTMEPLYRTQGLIAPGSLLAAEVAKIAAAERDPLRRTAAALALVQGKVRYLFKGMDNGNYVPQSPAETWATKYGDCKAKTLLLLAILHELGVDAEPTLANLGMGDLVAARLPSPGAFNHIFVVARVNGQTLWLDGTASGTYLEDIADVPISGWVLPLRPAGAVIEEAPNRAPARAAQVGTLNVDLRGGINLPAPFEAEVMLRGSSADMIRNIAANTDKKEIREQFQRLVPFGGGDTLVTASDVAFDEAAGTATIKLSGIAMPRWNYADRRYRYDITTGGGFTMPDRSRATWKDIPVETGSAMRSKRTIRMQLPDGGTGFGFEGNPVIEADLPGGMHAVRKAVIAGEVLTIDFEDSQTGAEIAPADFTTARAQFAEAKNRRLGARTVAGYPSPWHGVPAAKAAHRYDVVLARYASYIADKPEEPGRYVLRAGFLNSIFERDKAIADLDKAIAIQADAASYRRRAGIYEQTGNRKAAIADYRAALDLDPGDAATLGPLTALMVETGEKQAALTMLDEKIAEEGEDMPTMLSIKATALSRAGDAEGAIAASDAAIEKKPGNGQLLNNRCWIRGTMNVQLDGALADCTRAIQLSSDTAAALDSRAMVYFRMGKLTEALADLDAALEQRPSAASSLFLRGVVKAKMGKAKEGQADIADARLLSPKVDADYARWGIRG